MENPENIVMVTGQYNEYLVNLILNKYMIEGLRVDGYTLRDALIKEKVITKATKNALHQMINKLPFHYKDKISVTGRCIQFRVANSTNKLVYNFYYLLPKEE